MDIKLPDAPIPANAPALAEQFVVAARDISGHHLDYSRGSLALVQSVLLGLREEGNTTEAVASTLFCAGCYLGQTMVGATQGCWQRTEDSTQSSFSTMPMVVDFPGGGGCNPIGKVFKLFDNGPSEDLLYFYDIFSK